MKVAYVNPLTRTLAHYERELVETLTRAGAEPVRRPASIVEGLSGPLGKVRMLAHAAGNVIKFRNGDAATDIQIWPSLGLLEARLWSSRRRNLVIIHDPVPIQRQVGFGETARRWAAGAKDSNAPVILSHSADASVEIRRLLPRHRLVEALHPILGSMRSEEKTADPTVIVAGQYKPERDLRMLRSLGPQLAHDGIRAEIHGRGWPASIEGWTVHDRFVPDDELDRLLASAWVAYLPYRRYFQSGIAIRSLELGTLTVSPPTAFARDLFRERPDLVPDEASDVQAVKGAIDAAIARPDASEVFASYRSRVDKSWKTTLSSLSG